MCWFRAAVCLFAAVCSCSLDRCLCLSEQPAAKSSSSSQQQQLLRQRQLDDTVSLPSSSPVFHRVRVYLALYYLNHDVAVEFESSSQVSQGVPNLSNAVSHFCQAVNFQASGEQVQVAGEAVGATIDTRTTRNNDGSPNYECRIIDVNRSYDNDGEDLVGRGYFILEVAVQQRVYVTSNQTLSRNEVTDLVQNGFSRGTGGRSDFRKMLQQDAAFSTVLNVVLLDGALSPPQAAPSQPPSASPTAKPSAPPSIEPSSLSSEMPSMPPSPKPTQYPTVLPSSTPTFAPSLVTFVPGGNPTATPTQIPTTATTTSNPTSPYNAGQVFTAIPTAVPTVVSTAVPTVVSTSVPTAVPPVSTPEDNTDRKGQIIVAVLGGMALILVSCFFVVCVWPFCAGDWKDEDDDSEDSSASVNHGQRVPYNGQQLKSGAISSLQPTVVKASSLIPGHVHLDDHQSVTSGLLGETTSADFFRRPTSQSPQIRLVSPDDGIRMLDSFDESSLYTSTTSVSNFQVKSTVQTPVVAESYSGPVDLDDECSDGSGSGSYPFFVVKKAHSAIDDEEQGQEGVEVSEVMGEQSSAAPYDDSSGFGSNTSEFSDVFHEDNGESAFGMSAANSNVLDDSTLTADTARAKEIERILLGEIAKTEEGLRSFVSTESDEERLSATADARTDTVEPSLMNSPKPESVAATRSRAENNTLLRNVLEDARKLAESKTTPSVKSKLSRRSAPSRLSKKRRDENTSSTRSDTPHDILADHQDLEQALSMPSGYSWMSSRSVGGDIPRKTSKQQSVIWKQSPDSYPHSRTECKDGSPASGSIITTPDSATPSSAYGDDFGYLGAHPREAWSTISEENKDSETPTPSPSLPDRALLNRTTLGQELSVDDSAADHLAPTDIESTGGRSRRSVRTTSSRRSHRSGQERKQRPGVERSNSKHSVSASSSAAPVIDGGDIERSSETQTALAPRSLEQDLQRLENQIAQVLNHDADYITATSVTASSAGASRSTRSVRKSRKKRVVVISPPGKLGIILANRNDGRGTTVSEVRASSAMEGLLSPGDKLVAVDGQDVTGMVVGDITALMASRAEKSRRLTVITSAEKHHGRLQESKHEG